jgi:hypothetical protein
MKSISRINSIIILKINSRIYGKNKFRRQSITLKKEIIGMPLKIVRYIV